MKTHLLAALLSASALGLFCFAALADSREDNGNTNVGWCDGGTVSRGSCTNQDGCTNDGSCTNADTSPQGGEIDGSESLVATITLVATENAPAGAGGVADIVSDNENGTVTTSCSLSTTGLVSGVYTLSAVRKSDGSSVVIGDITLGNSGCRGGHDDGNDNEDDSGDRTSGGQCQKRGRADVSGINVSISEVTLPSDLDPMDIAQLVLSDSNGTVLLTGDLVDPAKSSVLKFKARIKIQGSSKSTNSGHAQALTTVKKGKRKDRFTMIASGLTPSTKFTVYVNGQPAGTAKSNKKGKALVRKVSKSLLTVRTVSLVDPSGQTAATTKF